MKVLIDTNVLFHSIDSTDFRKHSVAKGIVNEAFAKGAFICAQNLGELCSTAKRKFNHDQIESVKLLVTAVVKSENWIKLAYDGHTILKAASQEEYVDFWDSVIYFTMLENEVTTIITENEKDFKHFDGIRIINPFKVS